jgi:hypothetical protein
MVRNRLQRVFTAVRSRITSYLRDISQRLAQVDVPLNVISITVKTVIAAAIILYATWILSGDVVSVLIIAFTIAAVWAIYWRA